MSRDFLVVVLAVVAVLGADFVVTLRNTIAGGRGAGAATASGVGAASFSQGTLVSLGLGQSADHGRCAVGDRLPLNRERKV